jgi:hypothetical protein
MDIQNTASSSAYLIAELIRQRGLVSVRGVASPRPRVTDGVETSGVNVEGRGAGEFVALDELKAVLERLDRPIRLKEGELQRPSEDQTKLSSRTMHALNVYRAYFDLPKSEAKSALSKMLGVDVYA